MFRDLLFKFLGVLLTLRGRKLVGVAISFLIIFLLRKTFRSRPSASSMEYEIKTTWDNRPIDRQPVKLSLSSSDVGMVLDVSAPFYNDPQDPGGPHGEPFPKLWEFEVVEAFFLNDKEQYLEVELSPHGQHMVLLLSSARKFFKDLLPMKYRATIVDKMWTGRAIIPWDYFPPRVNKFNAFAIHGSGTGRAYWSLFPVPTDKYETPDFHRLEYFQTVDYNDFWPKTDTHRREPSSYWKAPHPV